MRSVVLREYQRTPLDGVSRAEADCLVYEVTMKAKATGHSKTPDEYAKDLLPVCKE